MSTDTTIDAGLALTPPITSLIAIMLGRLEMDVQPCIDAYSELSRRIFSKKSLPVDWRGHVNGRYKASELEDAIKKIVKDSGSPEDAPLSDGKGRGCRVYVVDPQDSWTKAEIPQVCVRSQKREQSSGSSSRLSI